MKVLSVVSKFIHSICYILGYYQGVDGLQHQASYSTPCPLAPRMRACILIYIIYHTIYSSSCSLLLVRFVPLHPNVKRVLIGRARKERSVGASIANVFITTPFSLAAM